MHCPFPGIVGKFISYFFKFAVPIFFMISGYFLYDDNREKIQQKLPKKIIHIFKLLTFSELFYGFYYLVFNKGSIEYNGIIDIISKLFTGTFFNGTLWFLYSLLWSYILLLIINKKNLYNMSFKLAPIVLILHIIIRILIKQHEWYNVMIFRNALVYGLPFVLIGMYIKQNQEIIKRKITDSQCLIGMIIGEVIVVLEYLLTKTSIDIYVGTIITSYFIFLFAIKNPNKYFFKIFKYIGDKLSMLIYIIHMLVIEMLAKIAICLSVYNDVFFKWFQPIIAVLASITFVHVYYKIFNVRKKERVNHD